MQDAPREVDPRWEALKESEEEMEALQGELRANLKSTSHRCHLFEVAFVWELTEETIHLPLSCLQGGPRPLIPTQQDAPDARWEELMESEEEMEDHDPEPRL